MGPAVCQWIVLVNSMKRIRLTSPPVTFLSAYLDICFLSSLFAAYFPTMAAMMDVCCWGIDCRERWDYRLKVCREPSTVSMAWFSRRGRRRQLDAPKIAVGDDWYAARLTETGRRVDVPESAEGRRVERWRREGQKKRRSRLMILVCMSWLPVLKAGLSLPTTSDLAISLFVAQEGAYHAMTREAVLCGCVMWLC
jgi:hypothetical protein